MTERRSSKMGMDSAMTNDSRQLIATQELHGQPDSLRVPMYDIQPDGVVSWSIPCQVSGTAQNSNED
jgi:hypothetical protein